MKNIVDYTATEARTKLFEILNSVYFGDKEVRIIKNRKPMVRIIKEKQVEKDSNDFFSLSGSLSNNTAATMLKEIKRLKKIPTRNEHVSA